MSFISSSSPELGTFRLLPAWLGAWHGDDAGPTVRPMTVKATLLQGASRFLLAAGCGGRTGPAGTWPPH
jgi:hypothetical protein